jgi:LSD1 subclass zinc finger protein
MGTEQNNEGDFALDMGDYGIPAEELRCPGCHRFLGYTAIAWGAIKIKCPNCKKWTTIDISPKKKVLTG